MRKALLIIFLISIATIFSGCSKCLKYEKQNICHKGWVQIIMTGKSTFPIFHPAYCADENVCVEWQKIIN
jgi:hypothetical protein